MKGKIDNSKVRIHENITMSDVNDNKVFERTKRDRSIKNGTHLLKPLKNHEELNEGKNT